MKIFGYRQLATATKVAGVLLILCSGSAVYGQVAGTWFAKGGYNNIVPHVSSGDLSAPSPPGAKIDIGSARAVILTGGYMITDNISTELYLGFPYKHDVIGDGSLKAAGTLGTVEQMPPTLFLQYRFLPAESTFRPYAGLGLTYAMFRKESSAPVLTALTNPVNGATNPTTFQVDNAWGLTPQIGATLAFNKNWFADFAFSKSFISTTTTLSTGQKISTALNPTAFNVSVGYMF